MAAIVLVAGVGGGVLWLRDTNPKGQPSLEMPVSGSNVEEAVVTSGEEVEVTVEGSNFKFSPSTIKASKGDTVRLTFKSSGGIHDLTVDEFDVQTSQLGDGEEEEVEFVAGKTGTFEYYCSVGNHRNMGMVGKLVVE